MTNSAPDPSKIPVEFEDLLTDTRLAMEICSILPDKEDRMGGQYEGKDLTNLGLLLELYEVENKLDMIHLIHTIISESMSITNETRNNNVGKKSIDRGSN